MTQATRTLPNIRQVTPVTVLVQLDDNNVYVDWSGMDEIRAVLFSDVQQVISGRFDVEVDSSDNTVLRCHYPSDRYEHLGVNRIIVLATYQGEEKAYDTAICNFVPRTEDVSGQTINVDDPVLDVHISVEEVSTSLLDAAIAAALRAADAAVAAAGKLPYVGDNGNWFVYDFDEEEYVDTEVPATGSSIYELAVAHGYEGTEAQYVQLYFDAITLAEAKATAANTAAGLANDAAAAADSATDAALLAAGTADDAADAANGAASDAASAASSATSAAAAAEAAAAAVTAVVGQAESAAEYASAQGDAAKEAAQSVEGAAENADAAATAANEAAVTATAAAEDAADAAADALENGNYAKDMGDYAKQEVNDAKGDFDTLNERFNATEDAAIEVDATTNPADAEYQDEYQRVLRVLYQAITDAKASRSRTEDATGAANEAAASANAAAASAASAAGTAAAAAAAAGGAASDAAHAMDEAKGDYPTIGDRLDAIEHRKQDVIRDLDTIRENAEAGAAAYQLPDTGIPEEDLSPELRDILDDAEDMLLLEENSNPASLLS